MMLGGILPHFCPILAHFAPFLRHFGSLLRHFAPFCPAGHVHFAFLEEALDLLSKKSVFFYLVHPLGQHLADMRQLAAGRGRVKGEKSPEH